MDRFERQTVLAEAWLDHCHSLMESDPKHIPLTEEGTATYDTNLALSRIVCTVPKCQWEKELKNAR